MVTKLGCISDGRLIMTVSKKKIGFSTELISEYKNTIGLDMSRINARARVSYGLEQLRERASTRIEVFQPRDIGGQTKAEESEKSGKSKLMNLII